MFVPRLCGLLISAVFLTNCPATSLLTEVQNRVKIAEIGAPSIFSVEGASGKATVTWLAFAGATSYNLYYAKGATVDTATGTKVPNVTSPYSISGLTNASTYAFAVTAEGSFGESAASPVVTAKPMPQWTVLGSVGISTGGASYVSLTPPPTNSKNKYYDTLYAAFRDGGNSNKTTVMYWDSSDWSVVGSAGFSDGAANCVSLAAGSTALYIAYGDDGNSSKATVKKLNGTSWDTVGSAGFSSAAVTSLSLAIGPSNTPYIAFQFEQSGSSVSTVMKYNSATPGWETVGGATISTSYALSPSIAIDSTGTPYVAYVTYLVDETAWKATVVKYNSTSSAWETVGNAGISAGNPDSLSIMLDSSDTPYVSYTDPPNGNRATVMKLNGTVWQAVGSAGFTSGYAGSVKMALDSSGMPYVVYQDESTKATVMRFNGTSWELVGSAGISTGTAYHLAIAITTDNGYPCIAYQDTFNGGKLTVMACK